MCPPLPCCMQPVRAGCSDTSETSVVVASCRCFLLRPCAACGLPFGLMMPPHTPTRGLTSPVHNTTSFRTLPTATPLSLSPSPTRNRRCFHLTTPQRSSGDSRGRWSSARRNSSNHSPASAGGTGPADTFPNSPSISPQAEREAEDPWAAADFLPGLPASDGNGHIAAGGGGLSGGVGCGVGSPGGVVWDRCVVRDGAGLPGSGSRMPSMSRDERGLSASALLPGGSSCGSSGAGQRRPKQLPGEMNATFHAAFLPFAPACSCIVVFHLFVCPFSCCSDKDCSAGFFSVFHVKQERFILSRRFTEGNIDTCFVLGCILPVSDSCRSTCTATSCPWISRALTRVDLVVQAKVEGRVHPYQPWHHLKKTKSSTTASRQPNGETSSSHRAK